jgi:hypothetical protein
VALACARHPCEEGDEVRALSCPWTLTRARNCPQICLRSRTSFASESVRRCTGWGASRDGNLSCLSRGNSA